MKKPHDELIDLLVGADWRVLWPNLVKYAALRASFYYWKGAKGVGLFTSGYQPEDIVNEAFLKAADGTIQWVPGKCSLDHFLMEIIRGVTYNLATRKENKDSNEYQDPNLESARSDSHFYLEYEYEFNLILKRAKAIKNPLVLNIAQYAIHFGVFKNDDLVELLKEDKKKIENARRILRGIVKSVRDEVARSENKIMGEDISDEK